MTSITPPAIHIQATNWLEAGAIDALLGVPNRANIETWDHDEMGQYMIGYQSTNGFMWSQAREYIRSAARKKRLVMSADAIEVPQSVPAIESDLEVIDADFDVVSVPRLESELHTPDS